MRIASFNTLSPIAPTGTTVCIFVIYFILWRTFIKHQYSHITPLSQSFEPQLIEGEGGSKDCDESEVLITGDHDSVDQLEAKFNTETGASFTDIMKKRLNQQFEEQGVQILDVIIKNVSLPEEIMSQMSEKTMVISRNAEQRMQQKCDMLTLLQREELITLEQSLYEKKMESKKGGDLEFLKESFELDHQKALGQDVLQKIIKLKFPLSEVRKSLSAAAIPLLHNSGRTHKNHISHKKMVEMVEMAVTTGSPPNHRGYPPMSTQQSNAATTGSPPNHRGYPPMSTQQPQDLLLITEGIHTTPAEPIKTI